MEFPSDVAFDPDGDIWVVDTENSRVQEWTMARWSRGPKRRAKSKRAKRPSTRQLAPAEFSPQYHFEYDTSEYKEGEGPHGNKAPVPAKAIGAGTEDVEVSETLGGLNGSTVYHFRVVAADGETTVYGEDQQFTTTGPLVFTEAATAVGGEAAILHGSVNPEGLETEYHFEYDTTEYEQGEGPHGTKVPVPDGAVGSGAEAVEVEETLEGLEAETTYHFRLVATNADGTIYGGQKTFTTFSAGWSLQETDLPSESANVWLRDVSCASSSECVAVGSDAGSATSQRWDGSEWSTLTNAEGTLLTDVSCSLGVLLPRDAH